MSFTLGTYFQKKLIEKGLMIDLPPSQLNQYTHQLQRVVVNFEVRHKVKEKPTACKTK